MTTAAATDTTLLALRRAICAQPAEDTPRLEYADRLQELGDEDRAEFIRVQCELAATPAITDGRFDQLRRRERELWPRFGARYERSRSFGLPVNWLALLTPESRVVPAAYAPSDGDITVSRGFVSHVTTTADLWLRHADALVWRPGATGECRECKGTGRLPDWYDSETTYPCGCDRGRVPREFKGTEQPITEVTFAGPPADTDVVALQARYTPEANARFEAWRSAGRRVDVGSLFGLVWPGVRFRCRADGEELLWRFRGMFVPANPDPLTAAVADEYGVLPPDVEVLAGSYPNVGTQQLVFPHACGRTGSGGAFTTLVLSRRDYNVGGGRLMAYRERCPRCQQVLAARTGDAP